MVLDAERARTFTAYDLRHCRLTQFAETGNLTGGAFLAGAHPDHHYQPLRQAEPEGCRAPARECWGNGLGSEPHKTSPPDQDCSGPAGFLRCEGEDLNLHGNYPASTSSGQDSHRQRKNSAGLLVSAHGDPPESLLTGGAPM